MLAAIPAPWSGVKASYINPHTKIFGVGVNNKTPYRRESPQLAAGFFKWFSVFAMRQYGLTDTLFTMGAYCVFMNYC